MSYEQALKDFEKVSDLTYFEPTEHIRICDLCYLCLHELDLHAEGEYWHPIAKRRALLKFCQKWGGLASGEEDIDYVREAEQQFKLGIDKKKSDCISMY